MADSTIFDLDPETALTAAHEFVTQDTSAATRAQAATFALMGGLEDDTTYDSAADHADATLTATGKLHRVNLSAMTSSFVPKLPIAANVNTGERVGFYITATHATAGRELFINTGAAGDKINEVDHSTVVFTKIWQVGESMVFECTDGATGDWRVVWDGRKASWGILSEGFADTPADQENSSPWMTSLTRYTLEFTTGADFGPLADIANNKLVIRRDGLYQCAAKVSIDDINDAENMSLDINFDKATGSATDVIASNSVYSAAAGKIIGAYAAGLAELTVAATKDVYAQTLFNGTNDNQYIRSATQPKFVTVFEVLT